MASKKELEAQIETLRELRATDLMVMRSIRDRVELVEIEVFGEIGQVSRILNYQAQPVKNNLEFHQRLKALEAREPTADLESVTTDLEGNVLKRTTWPADDGKIKLTRYEDRITHHPEDSGCGCRSDMEPVLDGRTADLRNTSRPN